MHGDIWTVAELFLFWEYFFKFSVLILCSVENEKNLFSCTSGSLIFIQPVTKKCSFPFLCAEHCEEP
jgi:hypothetical protein